MEHDLERSTLHSKGLADSIIHHHHPSTSSGLGREVPEAESEPEPDAALGPAYSKTKKST